MDDHDLIPRCSHGRIILSCPDPHCPEQVAYLERQQDSLDAYYAAQRAFLEEAVKRWNEAPQPPPEAIPTHSFWMSWYSPADMATFELHSPWWVSGYDADDNAIICAAVRAPDEEAARLMIAQAYDEVQLAITWRFTEAMDDGWSPFCGRFPKGDWMDWSPTSTCACPAHRLLGGTA